MDPHPTNYLRQNIIFSYLEMIRVSFSLFLSLSVFCYFTLLLIFIKIIFFIIIILFIYFHENYCYFFMFRDVPECSGIFGMFRNVPCSGFYRRPLLAEFQEASAEIGIENEPWTRCRCSYPRRACSCWRRSSCKEDGDSCHGWRVRCDAT